jgi:predicted nucleotidyltransferase
VDPRGATGLTPPSGALAELAAATRTSFPNLEAARRRTAAELARAGEALAAGERDPDVAVVLTGSWGRAELTRESDHDVLLLVRGEGRPEAEVRPSLEAVAAALGSRKPGPEAIFNRAVGSRSLVERVGLGEDDNANLTRRVLLVLESVAVTGEDVWREARAEVLDGYLEGAPDFRPPRFFLNDVTRYWRTIAVDFEAKHRAREGEKWGLRNAKLRTSRKVLYAGGLLPLLGVHRLTAGQRRAFLGAQFDAPPTDRIAWAFLEQRALDAGARTLGAYDRVLGLLADPAARAELEALSPEDARGSEVMREVRAAGDDLQAGLLALLFETPLERVFREYAVF